MKHQHSPLLFLLVAMPTLLFAQSDEYVPNIKPLDYKRYFSIGYVQATPVGEMSRSFNPWSYSGTFGEYRSYIKNRYTIGIEMSWVSFYGHEDRETHTFANGAITSESLRFYNNLGSQINLHYSLLHSKRHQLFAGVGTALFYNTEELRLGYLTDKHTAWTFGLTPELGFFKALSKQGILGFNINVRYSCIWFNSRYFNTAQYVSIKLGPVIRL